MFEFYTLIALSQAMLRKMKRRVDICSDLKYEILLDVSLGVTLAPILLPFLNLRNQVHDGRAHDQCRN